MEFFFQRFRPASTRSIASVFMIAALLIYGCFLASKIGVYAAGSDSSGYMNDARLLSDRKLIIEQRSIEGLPAESLPEFSYVPLGFRPAADHGMMVPTYPMGFPLMILGMSYLTGWDHAAAATLIFNALVAIAALYYLALLCGLSKSLAVLAAVTLGSSSIFISHSLFGMSDVPALTWCSLAMLFAMRACRDDRWALASGVAVAMSVLVRPTDALVMVPVAIAIGLSWRKWAWFVIGVLPGAIFNALINQELYGSIFRTGYGALGRRFGLEDLPLSLAAYAHWLPLMLTPGVFAILCAPFFIRGRPRILAMLVGWIVILLGFYSFYPYTHENWTYMRFALPASGAIIVLMLLVCQQWLQSLGLMTRRIVYPALLVFVLLWNGYWIKDFDSLSSGKGGETYRLAADWCNANLPQNAVLLSMQTSGSLFYYTAFTFVRWNRFTKDTFAIVERKSAEQGRPIYAVLFQFEEKEVLEERMPGRWNLVATIRAVRIWRRSQSDQLE